MTDYRAKNRIESKLAFFLSCHHRQHPCVDDNSFMSMIIRTSSSSEPAEFEAYNTAMNAESESNMTSTDEEPLALSPSIRSRNNKTWNEGNEGNASENPSRMERFLPLKGFIGEDSKEIDDGTPDSKSGDHDRSGIGSVGLLGGQMLSPILRSSEFGIHVQYDIDLESSHHIRQSISPIQDEEQKGKGNTEMPEPVVAASVKSHISAELPETTGNTDGNSVTEQKSPELNESLVSTGSNCEEAIQLAQQQAGASGQAFIQGLRGAAHRRKMNLTRSRDSLAAKEKERREEAERLAKEKLLKIQNAINGDEVEPVSTFEFRARPLPKSAQTQGVAGLPKIVKRQPTVPCSPLLGTRRASMPSTVVSKATLQPESNDRERNSFHARPIPKAVMNKGGQSGVPKVPKRPNTVPFSPQLGARRSRVSSQPPPGTRRASMLSVPMSKTNLQPENDSTRRNSFHARPVPKSVMNKGGQSGVPKVPKRPKTVPFSPLLGDRRPKAHSRRHSVCVGRERRSASSDCTPIGLAFVLDTENQENKANCVVQANPIPEFKEFTLRSTIRAEKRAEFDEYRKKRWEERQQEDIRLRRERIRRLERELGELRWEL